MNEEINGTERENKIARFKQAIEDLPGVMTTLSAWVRDVFIPAFQEMTRWFNSTGFYITYNHPATKHNGRRRSRREMHDHRQQVHFIKLAEVVLKKDGER